MSTDASAPRGQRALRSAIASWDRTIVAPGRAPALLAWVCVLALVLAATALIEGFLTLPSIRSVFALCAILGIAAAGQTIVVIVGGIDLSIPALMTLTLVGITELNERGWHPAVALLVLAVICAAIGAVNGLLFDPLQRPPADHHARRRLHGRRGAPRLDRG